MNLAMPDARRARVGGTALAPPPTRVGVLRVAIFDDDEFTRAGCLALLGKFSEIDLVSATDNAAAQRWRAPWEAVDAFVVDPTNEHRAHDQFDGIRVIDAIRRHRGDFGASRRPRIIAVSAHAGDDALRIRLREAGTDFLYPRSEVTTAADLVEIVRQPSASHVVAPPSDHITLQSLGITPRTALNRFVNHVVDEGLEPILRRGAALKQAPISARSRWWSGLRRDLANVSGIAARNCDGTTPHRAQETPSIAQFRRVFDWATKVKALRPAGTSV